MKTTLENRIHFKTILIYLVVALVCGGMIAYVYNLKKDFNDQRKFIEQRYSAIALTNELVYSLNQAQTEVNLYITSSNTTHLDSFRRKNAEIAQLIDSIKIVNYQDEQEEILSEISRLLKEKEIIVIALNAQLTPHSMVAPLAKDLEQYDTIRPLDSLLVSSVTKDTIINATPKKSFWSRLANVFSPDKMADTIVTIRTLNTDTLKISPGENHDLVSKLSDFTAEASKGYSRKIAGIEKELSRLILTDQQLSSQIFDLLSKFYRHTIDSTIEGIENSERVVQENYNFSIIAGALSLILILIFILLISRDVNQGKRARKALEHANVQIEQIMDMRHQLMLAISHDIKTPLNSILGYFELWQENNHTTAKEISSMKNSGQYILSLLQNLLEFSNLEQGKLQVSNSEFNLWSLCQEIRDMFESLALQKNLLFESDFNVNRELTVNADSLKIRQIITNLLSNSIKYTPEGKIHFKISCSDEILSFSVSDTGVGIPGDQMNTLFEPFQRIEKNNRLAEGSGLGLYVVKGLVDLMNGHISVESIIEKGTQISVEIPVKTVLKTVNNTPKNILIIDDDSTMLSILQGMILKLGHKVTCCDAPTHFEHFLTHEVNYDIIITDMEMGMVSGIDVLKKIKDTNIASLVIIMTGQSDFNLPKAIEIGFDKYLAKPISMNSLCQLIGNASTNEVCDLSSFEEIFDEDINAMRDVLETFTGDTANHITLLREALSENDFRKAQALCHKMLPMFMQLQSGNAVEILKKMDALRSADATQYPEWKNAISELIEHAELLIATIHHKFS